MLALARKYRPKNFASVAVQSHVSNTLKGAIARGRVAHGYLLCGPRGTGKTTLARVLAMALNCETLAERRRQGLPSDGEPCGTCPSCQRTWSGSASLDVVEIDAASNRGVEDARELRERAMYAPSGDDRYKVYIVDEAHMLTREAWNALLKILEEPPPRVVFVFATTEPQKIAQAAAPVLSRLQRFDLKRIGPAEIRERLAAVLAEERVPFEADALAAIARAADGGLRDALSLTDQVISLGDGAVTIDRVREALGLVAEDEYLAVLDLLAERRAGDVFATVARLADMGIDFGGFLTGLADMLRAQLAVELGGATPDLSERARAALEERRGRLSASDVLRMLHLLGEMEPRFRRSGQQQLLLETLLVRCALMDRAVSLEDVLRGLGEGGGGGGGGADAGARPARAGSAPSPTPPARGAAAHPPASPPVAARAAVLDAPRPTATVVEPWRGEAPAAAAPAARAASAPPATPEIAAVLDTLEPRARVRDEGERGDHRASPPVTAAADAAPRPHPSPSPSPSPSKSSLPDLNRVLERWDEVTAHVRAAGNGLAASVLEHAQPVAVAGNGTLTLQVEDETAERAVDARRDAVVAALAAVFDGALSRLVIRCAAPAAERQPARRLTTESVKAERLAALRKRDAVLGAAVDALDLELLD